MKIFTLSQKPKNLVEHRKNVTVMLGFQSKPFKVDTQEGVFDINPDTVDDWDGGYYVAYPSNGSKPYAICPKFVRENYEPV